VKCGVFINREDAKNYARFASFFLIPRRKVFLDCLLL